MHTRHLAVAAMLSLTLAVSPAVAVQKRFTWVAPTTNSDSTTLSLDKYTVYRSGDGGASWALFTCAETATDPKLLNRLCTDTTLPTGSICYNVTASNSKGESGHSGSLCFSVPGAPPNPPSGLQEVSTAPATKRAAPKAP